LGVDRSVLYHWRNLMPGEGGMGSDTPVRELRKEIRDLKRALCVAPSATGKSRVSPDDETFGAQIAEIPEVRLAGIEGFPNTDVSWTYLSTLFIVNVTETDGAIEIAYVPNEKLDEPNFFQSLFFDNREKRNIGGIARGPKMLLLPVSALHTDEASSSMS